jgi:hypothetical protein
MIDEPDREAAGEEFATSSDAERITSSLGVYANHKTVRAGRIMNITAGWHLTLELADGTTERIRCDPVTAVRHAPRIGDWYVVYADGRIGITPAKAFEEGFTLIASAPA